MPETVSDKPWSDFKASDYTLTQWTHACLIHPADGNMSKSHCKLPVREPDGTLNRNAVHAAAAVLAGARGGVDATLEQKASAVAELAKLYKVLGEEIPPSLTHSDELDSFLARYGVESVLAHADTGNTTAVVVALPSQLDAIRLVGDEEKHATILFFGETSSLPEDAKATIIATLEQASKFTPCFYERVQEVSRLGSDVPPALVAMLSNQTIGKIRNLLRVNPKIDDYLSNTAQFPTFTPHVTLARPDYSGEAELRKMVSPLIRVKFDRLALWWNDEHFEFDLNNLVMMDDGSEKLAMAEELDNFLAHFGVKGMKWGVRRTDAQLAKAADGKSEGDDNTRLSADAERTAHTLGKSQQEMSTREIKEANDRANAVAQYNKFFADKTDPALASKLANLQAQQEINRIQSELTPAQKSAVARLVGASKSGFQAFQTMDGVFHGNLTKAIEKKIGLTSPPSEHDRLKAETALFNARREHIEAQTKLKGATPTPKTEISRQTQDFLSDLSSFGSESRAATASTVSKSKSLLDEVEGLSKQIDRVLDLPEFPGARPGRKLGEPIQNQFTN